jgi:hypothetical protein
MNNLSPQTIYKFIVSDFESPWNALAALSGERGRGNFMFARQAMSLLEFAARLCKVDSTGKAVVDLSRELNDIDPRYFCELPGVAVKDPLEFNLPRLGSDPQKSESQLIRVIFDLVRNGQAHQYQQILVQLPSNGGYFAVQHTGAEQGCSLDACNRPSDHLTFRVDGSDLLLKIRTDTIFLDLKRAIERSSLLTRGLVPFPLERSHAFVRGLRFTNGASLTAWRSAFSHAGLRSVV